MEVPVLVEEKVGITGIGQVTGQLFQPVHVFGGRLLHGFLGQGAFHLYAQVEDMLYFLGRGRHHDDGPLVGDVLDQAGFVQAHEGIPDGAAPHAELFFQIHKDKSGAGQGLTGQDHVADQIVGRQRFDGRSSTHGNSFCKVHILINNL